MHHSWVNSKSGNTEPHVALSPLRVYFCLIEFHCSYSSVSMSAQVALTAATRQHLGLCIFWCVNVCIHCAGAGLALNIIQSIFLSCTISLTSPVTVCNAMMPWLFFWQKYGSGLSLFCSRFLFRQVFFTFFFFSFLLAQQQANMCHSTAAGHKGSCYFLQLSGGSWNGFIAGGSCVSSPSEVDERSNG